MKLPNAEHAVVPERKITAYLLSETHPRGKHKARVFRAFGFTLDDWQTLAQALSDHAARNDVAKTELSSVGQRFVIEGIIETPIGRLLAIRSVWFLDSGESIPRFVTAYPLRKGGS
jgi:hypothetical protein